MITEDVGKLILSTQGDVKRFKEQLLTFAENNVSQGIKNLQSININNHF